MEQTCGIDTRQSACPLTPQKKAGEVVSMNRSVSSSFSATIPPISAQVCAAKSRPENFKISTEPGHSPNISSAGSFHRVFPGAETGSLAQLSVGSDGQLPFDQPFQVRHAFAD